MRFPLSHNSIEVDFEFIIETLKNASLTRDFKTFEQFLEPYFENDLASFFEYEQAYLNYFLGYYFIHFGKAKNLPNYQERGKNHLTTAADLFHQLELPDEALEAQISLGFSYFQTGVIPNYEAYLLDALSRCEDYSEAFFSVNVSLLIVYYKEEAIDKGIEKINSLKPKISSCQNYRILCQFYTNAGLILQEAQKYTEAIEFYEKAIYFARELKNKQFEGLSLNCLAYCYLFCHLYDFADQYVEAALQIFKDRKEKGFIAEVLDTKAQIQSAKGHIGEALTTINAALNYFRQGENYFEFAATLWNKIEILYRLEKKIEIIETFGELSIVTENLGLQKQKEYYAKFEKLVLFPFGETYDEKLINFQKEVILPVLESTGVTEAARQLGFKHHQNLSNLIKRQNLKEPQRLTRADRRDIFPIPKPANILIEGTIKQNQVKYFQVSVEIAKYLNFEQEMIFAILEENRFSVGDWVLVETYHELVLTELVREGRNFYFVDLNGNTIIDEQAKWIGRVVGYTTITALTQGKTEFKIL